MTEKKHDIIIESGADFSLPFTLFDDSYQPIDLTGAVVEAQLREYPEDTDYLQFVAVHGGASGKISISMPYEETATIGFTSGVYDVFVTYSGGTRERVLYGSVDVDQNVTRPIMGTMLYMIAFGSLLSFPSVGDTTRIYYDISTNKMYRWNGASYVSAMFYVSWGEIIGTLIDQTDLKDALDLKSDDGHDHDSRYYTEGEVDTFLSLKVNIADIRAMAMVNDAPSDNSQYARRNGQWVVVAGGGDGAWGAIVGTLSNQTDLQDALDQKANTADLGSLADQDTVDWDTEVTDKPATYPPDAHNHDDRYYTEGEVDGLLGDKANTADLGSLASQNDTGSDNKLYGRMNGAWQEISISMTGGVLTISTGQGE